MQKEKLPQVKRKKIMKNKYETIERKNTFTFT